MGAYHPPGYSKISVRIKKEDKIAIYGEDVEIWRYFLYWVLSIGVSGNFKYIGIVVEKSDDLCPVL